MSPAFTRAPTPEQTAEMLRQSKVYRRQGGSFDALGLRTLDGGSYDSWLDKQPWPQATAQEHR